MSTDTPPRDRLKAARRSVCVTFKALPEHNRLRNRTLVLQSLFHDRPMSRADLARYRLALSRHVSAACGAPDYLVNASNVAALSVHTYREASGQSVMVVTIEHGAGTGLTIGGALVQDERFAAGEIGHVVVDEDGGRCACCRHGCLGFSVAAPASGRDSVPRTLRVALSFSVMPVAPSAWLSRPSSAHSTARKSCYLSRPRSLRAHRGHGTSNRAPPHYVGRQ